MTCQTTSTLTLTTWGQDQWYICKSGDVPTVIFLWVTKYEVYLFQMATDWLCTHKEHSTGKFFYLTRRNSGP